MDAGESRNPPFEPVLVIGLTWIRPRRNTARCTVPWRPGGDWEELEGVRTGSAGGVFPPNPELSPRTRYLAQDPSLPTRLYAGIEVGGLLVSDNGGATWEPANEGLTDPDVHQLCHCSHNPELVLAACGEGLFRSVDRASHWAGVTPHGSRTYGTTITETAAGTVYLGISLGRPNTWLGAERANSAIIQSREGGLNWKVAAEGLRASSSPLRVLNAELL